MNQRRVRQPVSKNRKIFKDTVQYVSQEKDHTRTRHGGYLKRTLAALTPNFIPTCKAEPHHSFADERTKSFSRQGL